MLPVRLLPAPMRTNFTHSIAGYSCSFLVLCLRLHLFIAIAIQLAVFWDYLPGVCVIFIPPVYTALFMINRLKLISLITISGVSISCVETIIFMNVYPDGRYFISYTTRGDSTDVFNADFPHPAGAAWSTSVLKKKKENDDAIWVMETAGMAMGTTLFTDIQDSLISLQHPVEVKRLEGLFSTRYTLKNTFKGREVSRKYPMFGRSLLESTEDSTRWLDEAFYYICSAGISDLQKNPVTHIDDKLAERVVNHIYNTLARISQQALFHELDDKLSFITQMLRPFHRDLPRDYCQLLSSATDIYQAELELTSNLHDDQFQYRAVLPGIITTTNADTIIGDTLKWTFGLQQYMDDDFIITAASVVYVTRRIQVAALIIAGILLITIFVYYRRKQ